MVTSLNLTECSLDAQTWWPNHPWGLTVRMTLLWLSEWSNLVVSNSLQPQGPITLLRPWDFPGKSTGVGCHFLLLWTTFCQKFSLWPIHLELPWTAWLIASLSYTSSFSKTRLWSMKGVYKYEYMYMWMCICTYICKWLSCQIPFLIWKQFYEIKC